MLYQLTVENIALIERQLLEWSQGLTVITGETGAGKSMILDALNLVLGERADSSLVRFGAEQASVQAQFLLPDLHPALDWLAERAMNAGEEGVFLRRVASAAGRSRSFINETSVPLNTLKQLGDLLVDIHGQHDHQSLLDSQTHLEVLDAFAGCLDLAGETRQAWELWRQAEDALLDLHRRASEATSRRAFLTYQVEELEKHGVMPGELAELESRRARQSCMGRLVQAVDHSLAALAEGRGAAVSQVHQAASDLEGVAELDASLKSMAESARSLHYELEDLADRLGHYRTSLDADPELLAQLDERLATIRHLARKHHRSADELTGLLAAWQEELRSLDDLEVQELTLGRQRDSRLAHYHEKAKRLTRARRDAARRLEQEVETQLRELYMVHTRLVVTLTPVTGEPRPTGLESVTLLVSTNPGEPAKPLRQVASGGELARLMLALRTVLADAAPIATLVFDEVDTGVGGRVADAIGAKLARIARAGRQVIAITHLPQVAARGDVHWRVEKQVVDGRARVSVVTLDEEERVEELARMLAGEQVTQPARLQARELLRIARSP